MGYYDKIIIKVIVKDLPLLIKGLNHMEIMELHQLISLCSNETDAFEYLFKNKK